LPSRSCRLEKFNVTASYRLRAKYPIRPLRAYGYYDPEVKSVARPVEMEIRNR
jgi:hypothetical protein